MTTLLDLPEEILLIILAKLPLGYKLLMKQLCRTLYRPANLTLLAHVKLGNLHKTRSFLDFVNHLADPAFRNAVKEINYHYDFTGYPEIDQELMQQLFFGFPNLRNVQLTGTLKIGEGFTDELCKTILENCPKLDTFEVYLLGCSFQHYCDFIFKVRLLQTSIDLCSANFAVSRYGGLQQFVLNFPRLQKIYGASKDIKSMENLLRIVKVTPHLKHIRLVELENDREGFEEDYFATMPLAEQHAIKGTLSNVTELHLCNLKNANICIHAMKFVAKYFTGLNFFSIKSFNEDNEWTHAQEEAFMYMLDILCSLKDGFKLDINNIRLDFLASRLPTITQLTFCPKLYNESRKKSLQITVVDTGDILRDCFLQKDSVELHIESSKGQIYIPVSDQITLNHIVTTLLTSNEPFTCIDKFVLYFDSNLRYLYDKPVDISVYEKLFQAMPLLKEVILDVPASIQENYLDSRQVHPQLGKMTLRTTPDTNYQTILDKCGTGFPNLKHLTILYSCGIWNKDRGEFQITLQNSLDKLTLDVTPVTRKMKYRFFVLDVQLFNGKRHLYTISSDLLSIVHIKEKDLESLFKGDSYVRVRATLKSLKSLVLFVSDTAVINYLDFDENLKHTVIELQNR